MENEEPVKEKSNIKARIAIIIAAVILIIILVLAWLYTGTLSSAKIKVFEKLSLPSSAVHYSFIPAKDVISRYQTLQALAAAGHQDFNPTTAKSQAIDASIADKKLQVLANRNNVSVSSDELESQYKQILAQLVGSDETQFEKVLHDYYALDKEQFQQQVLKNSLLRDKMQQWFYGQRALNADAYKLADQIIAQAGTGKDFGSLAQQYSTDAQTATFNGDSGFLQVDQLLPEIQQPLTDAKKDEIKTLAGYDGIHIIKILDRDSNGEGGKARVRLQEIFLKGADYTAWYDSQAKALGSTNFFSKVSFK